MKGGVLERLRKSVEQGNMLEMTDILEDIHPEEPVILSARYERSVWIKRPSTEGKLEIRQPNLLMIAVLGWFPEIVSRLIKIGADVNDVCELVEYDDTESKAIQPLSSVGNVSALMLTAITGRVDHARYLLDNGALVNAQDSRGDTALMKTCQEEHLSVLDLLVTSGANIEHEDSLKTTPLMKTAECGYLNILAKLLNLGADVNKRDIHGRNALFYAAMSPTQAKEIVKLLINNGCQIHPDNQGVSLLMQAASVGEYDLVEYLLEYKSKFHIQSNVIDLCGRNALYHACLGGSQEIMEHLVQFGEMFSPAMDSSTAIMAASMKNHTSLLHCLIPRCGRFNLSMNSIDVNGRNALFYSIQGGHVDNFVFLIKCGVEIQVDNNLQNVLMYAVELKRTQIINYILENSKLFHSLKMNDVDREGKNVLFYAVHSGNIDLFNRLYNQGAETCISYKGVSLLMHACKMGYPKFAGFLYENKETLELNVAWKDNDGRNILFYCVEGGNVAILDFFLEHSSPEATPGGFTLLMQAAMHAKSQMIQRVMDISGIDFTAMDEKGQTALFYSVISGRTEVLQLLLQKGLKATPNSDGTTLLMLAAKNCTANLPNSEFHSNRISTTNGLFLSDLNHHYKMLDFLLEHCSRLQLDINALDMYGRNVFFYGILSRDCAVLEKLKLSGAKPVADKNGQTILMCACSAGSIDMVDWLFDSFNERKEFVFDSTAQDEYGNDVYFYSLLLGGSVELILHLLSKYRIPVHTNNSNHSFLAILYSKGDTANSQIILNYFEKYCSDSKQLMSILSGVDSEDGLSVFDYFVKLNDHSSLKKYFSYFRSGESGLKASHLLNKAVDSLCASETIECLLEFYQMHLIKDKSKQKILNAAASTGLVPVVKLLLSYGFRPNSLTKDGSNILHACCLSQNYYLFRHFLLFFKQDLQPLLSRINSADRSVIHLICELGLTHFFDLLLDNISEEELQVQMELTNSSDQNALMFACSSGRNEFFTNQCFLNHMTKNKDLILATDNEKCNPLHYACSALSPHPAIIERLLSCGLAPDDTNKENSTPLMLAIQRDNLKVVRQLLEERGSDCMMMQNSQGWNSFDLCSLKQNVISVFIGKEFGLDKASEKFLEIMLRFNPEDINLPDLVQALADRSLILSQQNCQTICSLCSPNNPELNVQKAQGWQLLVNLISVRGKGRLSELCSLLATYDSQLSKELFQQLTEEENIPDEF